MRAAGCFALLVLLGVGLWRVRARVDAALPEGLAGTLVFVSDRSGLDSLYLRRLPSGPDERLTFLSEPAREPALSPDGGRVAFSVGGRIGLLTLSTREVRMLSLGVDWRDGTPSWRPDGKELLVVSRRGATGNGEVCLLSLEPGAVVAGRRLLTETPGLDESAPVFGASGDFVVYVREENLFRLDLAGGRARRLTGGFRRVRSPRVLASGRIVCLWSQDKRHGIDVLEADGSNRQTLTEGSVYYRTLAPSPDGRFLASTFTFDLGFRPSVALRLRQTEEVRLLDAGGKPLATLAGSWRHSNHSPSWAR
jgi:Tol biopolymer transport system component